jgi:hypothetical protein
MGYGEKTTCKGCGNEIVQRDGGHRKRHYCDDACRQNAFRKRREQTEHEQHQAKIREQFGTLQPKTLQFYDTIIQISGPELAQHVAYAINAECGHQTYALREITTQGVWQLQKRVSDLEQELASLTQLASLSDREKLQHDLLFIGEQVHYPWINSDKILIPPGVEAWV